MRLPSKSGTDDRKLRKQYPDRAHPDDDTLSLRVLPTPAENGASLGLSYRF